MGPLRFEKIRISDERYESVGVFDVNNDGVLDIVSGAFWYEGPDFKKRHFIGEVRAVEEWYDDFSTIPLDVNCDGLTDYITGGWWGNTVRWRQNPGPDGGEWPEHIIAEVGNVETTRGWDVDGDGTIEIVPNTPNGPLRVFKLVADSAGKAEGPFSEHLIHESKQGHGFGFGDVTGNGRGDFVLSHGWLEAPPKPLSGEWTPHEYLTPDGRAFELGSASCPILVADVNGDGLADLIVGQAHGYGLDWYQQRFDGEKRTWIKHPIDPFNSQYHDMHWVDIDGDGQCELVTGKRYRAHNGNDPGADDPVGIYYFKFNGECFTKLPIDFGPAAKGIAGAGIHFAIADLAGTGRPDVVAAGKTGLYVFRNLGPA